MPEAVEQPVPEQSRPTLKDKTLKFFTKHRMTIMWGGAGTGAGIIPALSSGRIEALPILAAIGLGLGALYDRRENNAKREYWQDENLMDQSQKPSEQE